MWILFALTSAIILASRKMQEKQLVGSTWGALGWMIRLGSGFTALCLWLVFSRSTENIMNSQVWIILGIISLIIYPLYTLGYYYAVKHLPLSYFGMLGIIAPVSNTVFSYFLIGQVPTIAGSIGIGVIIIGLIILFYKHENKNIPILGLIVAIAVYISMGFNPILDKIVMKEIDPFTYTMLNQLSVIIPVFVMSYFLSGGTKIEFYKKNIVTISIIGITQWIGWLWSMLAFQNAPNTWYAVALINTHAIITTLYGVFALKEGVTKKKILVFLCMMIALVSFTFA